MAANYLLKKQLLSYPAHQAYSFTELVNTRNFEQVKKLINNEKNLRGYGPATVIKQALNGSITPNSPFYSQTAWQNWDENSALNKEAFKAVTLFLLEQKETKSLSAAHRISETYKKIKNLE
jgi:hypothetical protein